MKQLLLFFFFAVPSYLSCAQAPALLSLVGSYPRDNPKYNPNYERMHPPCFKRDIQSSVGFRGYDERQDWQGWGEAISLNSIPPEPVLPPIKQV